MNTKSPALREYLEEVAVHLPRPGRADLLLELESHILDRAEESHGESPDEEAIRDVLGSFGEPAKIAAAYGGERFLIGPGLYRSFVAYTGIVYAVHLLMILVGVATGAQIHLFPARIASDGPLPSWFELLGVAIHTLLFDIGLVVVIFALASHAGTAFRTPSIIFRVRRSRRASIARAVLSLIVILGITTLRDRLFVVFENERSYSILTSALVRVIPGIVALLVLTMAKEITFACRGEDRVTLLSDALVGLYGVILMVVLVAGPALIAFPDELSSLRPLQPHLNTLVMRVVQLLLVALAAVLATGMVKRLVRLRQIWS